MVNMRKGMVIPAALLLLCGTNEVFAGFSYDGASPGNNAAPVQALPAGGTISFQPEQGDGTVSVPNSGQATTSPMTTSGGGLSPVPAGNADIQRAIDEARRKRAGTLAQPSAPQPISSSVPPRQTAPTRKQRKSSSPAGQSLPQPVAVAPAMQQSVAAPVMTMTALALRKGSLREQLETFCKHNGSQLAWHASNDIIINNDTYFDGSSFQETLRQLFEALNTSGHYFKAEYFSGNNLLLVDDMRK